MKVLTSAVVVVLALVVLECHVDLVNGCNCIMNSNAERYCAADYALHVRLEAETIENRTYAGGSTLRPVRVYKITTLNTLRRTAKYDAVADKNHVITETRALVCGIEFPTIGLEALICGYVKGGELYTHRCTWTSYWNLLEPTAPGEMLNGTFGGGC